MKKNKKVSLDKKPFFVLSRRAVTGWTCAAFVVCAWMFFIGVLVGRGTAPVRFDLAAIQKQLEATRDKLRNDEQLQMQWKSGTVRDKTTLDFYEALKDNRGDSRIDPLKSSPPVDKVIERPPEKKSKAPASQNGESGEVIGEKDAPPQSRPVEQSPKQAKDSGSKPRISGVTYTVQAASLKDRRDADRLVAMLKQKGFPAHRAIGKVPGKGIWYRVRIGEFKSKADAHKTLKRLKQTGMQPIIIENLN